MGVKTFAAAAGVGLITTVVALPVAYHSRDIDFWPNDVYNITQEDDGTHIHVTNTKLEEISDIRLIMNEDGQLVGKGVVMGDDYEVIVDDPNEEALFVHEHGAEKLWLGRDVVHVQPAAYTSDTTVTEPDELGL